MAVTPPKSKAATSGSYECVHCCHPMDRLYISYPNRANNSLLNCPSCGNSADVYQTLPFSVILVDLLLFNKRVYRHLLCNRGSASPAARARERRASLWRVGAVVVALDAYIRCVHASTDATARPFLLYGQTLAYCLLETVALHLSIALAALANHVAARSQPGQSLRLLPLTLFYTSIPTLFLLVISSLIFRTEYAKPTSSEPNLGLWLLDGTAIPDLIARVGGERLLQLLCGGASWASAAGAQGGVVRGWANEVVLRKAVGGSSAIVGLSVLLRTNPARAGGVLLLGWAIQLAILSAVDRSRPA